MKKFNNDFKYLVSVWVILIIGIVATYAHHGHLLVDCGREVYYPTQILLGKVLYKDIFNIYGPFSYMLNAALFKFFSINLNVLYLAGSVCAFLITSLIYLISRRFLNEFLSFAIAIFTIATGVLNLNLFNFIFPYSYAILYGIVAFLMSVLFLLKYQESPEKTFYLYSSCFFAGLCVANKYEFLPYLAVILYGILKIKRLNFKQYYFTIFSLLFVPAFCFGILFLQGLAINDLASTFKILKQMAHSQSLKYFYHTQGVYFDKSTMCTLALNFIKTIIPIGVLNWGIKIQRTTAVKKTYSIVLILISILLMFKFINASSFVFLPIMIVLVALILAAEDLKSLRENKALLILFLSGLTVSLKVFWGLATLNYGVYFASFLIITVIAMLIEKNVDEKAIKKLNQNGIGVYLLVAAIILGWHNLLSIKTLNLPLKTPRGTIYSNTEMASASTELISYIDKNTKKTDTVVVFPEGPFINFLADRKSDNYYNSLIPLYLEVFGEDKLIKHFQKTKPEYIIFNNLDNSNYYFKYICSDYAVSFCNYVAQNYSKEKTIDKGFRYLIFKLK